MARGGIALWICAILAGGSPSFGEISLYNHLAYRQGRNEYDHMIERTTTRRGHSTIASSGYPGVTISEMRIAWQIKFSEELWGEIVSIGKTDKPASNGSRKKSDSDVWVDLGLVLLPRAAGFAVAGCLRNTAKPKAPLTISVALHSAPDKSPPQKVRILDKQTGGPQGMSRMLNHLTERVEQPTPIARYRFSFRVNGKKGWSGQFIPKSVTNPEEVLVPFGSEIKLEHVGYRFKEGVMGMTEVDINYLHRNQDWEVSVISRAPLNISEKLEFPHYSELLKFLLERLFARKVAV